MSHVAHPLELAVALGLLAPHSLDRDEDVPREPTQRERAAVEVEFLEVVAQLDEALERVAA